MTIGTGVRARIAAQDDVGDALERALMDIGDAIEARLLTLLGGDTDALASLINPTTFDEKLANLRALAGEPEAVRIALLTFQLREVDGWIGSLGLDEARRQYFVDGMAKLEDAVEAHLSGLGLPGVATVLDAEGVRIAVSSFQDSQDEQLFGKVRSTSATAVLDALKANAEMLTDKEFARRVAEAHDLTVPQSMTEARTRLAEADRFIGEQAVREVERSNGIEFLRGYAGPTDGKVRPFCSKLVGKAFAMSQVEQLNNRQVGNPIDTGGGYNCRHLFEPVMLDELEDLGFVRGTDGDIMAANEAAGMARKRKKQRRAA